jgi:hypothetical protein
MFFVDLFLKGTNFISELILKSLDDFLIIVFFCLKHFLLDKLIKVGLLSFGKFIEFDS